MNQNQSKKKFFEKSENHTQSSSYVDKCVLGYNSLFTVHRRSNFQTAKDYVKGLLKCEKGQANMERIGILKDNEILTGIIEKQINGKIFKVVK